MFETRETWNLPPSVTGFLCGQEAHCLTTMNASCFASKSELVSILQNLVEDSTGPEMHLRDFSLFKFYNKNGRDMQERLVRANTRQTECAAAAFEKQGVQVSCGDQLRQPTFSWGLQSSLTQLLMVHLLDGPITTPWIQSVSYVGTDIHLGELSVAFHSLSSHFAGPSPKVQGQP